MATNAHTGRLAARSRASAVQPETFASQIFWFAITFAPLYG
jgi:hypothetical protein